MTTYKLIALDMDGSLLNEEKEISPDNLQVLHRCLERGVIVCLATGREINSVSPYIDRIGAELPLVTVNGSEVWMHRDQLYSRVEMDAALVIKLRSWALEHRIGYWGTAVEGVFHHENWRDDAAELHWLKFGMFTDDTGLLAKIRHEAEQMKLFEITNSHPGNLEFNPRGVNKAAGLQKLCKVYGIAPENMIAVGDSVNDVAMIRAAGLGVAMGNAQEEVKRQADMVTLSNEEDGVAHIIRKIVLEEA